MRYSNCIIIFPGRRPSFHSAVFWIQESYPSGYLLPVITSHCDYKVGANFEDTLVVNTIIKELPKPRLRIDYEVHRDNSDELLVSGYTIHAFTDKSGKAVKPPKQLVETLKQNF